MNLKQAWQETMKCTGWENKETDTEWYQHIDNDKKEIMISFQGSTSKLDWKLNFSFWKKPYKDMKHLFFVHAGFLKRWKSIEDDIMKIVKDHPGYKIKLRGYSQGSSTCYLAHEAITFHTQVQPETVCFGTPRVFSILGSKVLKRRLSEMIRVENGDDIVCHVPFAIMLYRHFGKKIHIGKKRNWFRFSIKDHLTYNQNLEE